MNTTKQEMLDFLRRIHEIQACEIDKIDITVKTVISPSGKNTIHFGFMEVFGSKVHSSYRDIMEWKTKEENEAEMKAFAIELAEVIHECKSMERRG